MAKKRIVRDKHGDEEVIPCPTCKWLYPDWWLNPIMINGGYTAPTCAICALQLINEALGIKRKRFDGSQAEYNRQLCLDWRSRHPELKPNANQNKPSQDGRKANGGKADSSPS